MATLTKAQQNGVAAGEPTVKVALPPIEQGTMTVTLIGDSPLICHAWSEKAKKMILDDHMKKAKQAKPAQDPEQEYRESMYYCQDGRPGFPAAAFKAAAVAACRFADAKMTEARGAFHVLGGIVPIEGEPELREDMVRLNGVKADIRYRAMFRQWRVRLTIIYNARAISPEQILNFLNTAGFGVGVGEWRPERDGSFGLFHVAGAEE